MKKTFKPSIPDMRAQAEDATGSNTDLPEDLAALFAAAPKTTDADRAQLEKAARALHQDPSFLADYAKGIIVEDILRAMEKKGISANALAGMIGKTRQYVSKILREDRRVNFTIDTLAQLSVALDVELYLRLTPKRELAFFIQQPVAPIEIARVNPFPDERLEPSVMPESAEFVPANIIPFREPKSHEQTSLSA